MKLIVDKNSLGLENKEFVEYLKTPVRKTEITNDEADELRMQLTQALIEHPGLGISATQIGIKKRACLIKFGDEELFLVNPQVIERSNDGFVFIEGCLSIPKIYGPVPRYSWVEVEYLTPDFTQKDAAGNPVLKKITEKKTRPHYLISILYSIYLTTLPNF